MLREALEDVARGIEGLGALALIDRDGMPVHALRSRSEVDLELLAAELLQSARAMAAGHREFAIGDVCQLSVITDRWSVLLQQVADSYYLLLVLPSGVPLGKARYALRRSGQLLESELQ